MQNRENIKQHKLTGAQTILLGFFLLILIGMILLMLPVASRDRNWTMPIDALFTATSASCVTGLVVRDTQTTWTLFGQVVIILLIQVGGMGVVTMTTTLNRLTGRRIGLKARTTMQEAVSAPNLGGIVKYTRFIFIGCAFFETLGALAMAPVFIKDFGVARGIWYAIFTSISAFCNAGFDLDGSYGPFSSLTHYADNPVIIITVVCLILTGGHGFLTWRDIRDHGLRFRRYSTQSKIIIIMELILVIVPSVILFFAEYSNLPLGERILSSLLQAVTPRTAGFNSTDYNNFSDSGIVMTIILMLIGGAPGSTAGGMKITTVAVLFVSMISVFRHEKSPAIFKRTIPNDVVSNAVSVFLLYLILPTTGAMLISRIEDIPFLSTMFESASAVATVGLTMGITSTLTTVSKAILIILMYTGRVGGLTLVFAAISRKSFGNREYPKDNVAVG